RIDASDAPAADSFEGLLQAQPDVLAFDPQLGPGRIAALFHTGGTTGAPKLVQHTHGNEAHTAWFAHRYYGFDETTVEINGFPLFHVAGAFVYGLSLLAIGACQVLPTVTGMRNAAFLLSYWAFCERESVTALAAVPTILAGLCNTPIDADISRVRVAYTGGSPLPTELAARFEATTGIAVRNILGMTESAGLVSIEPTAAPRVPGSAGLRLPYTELRVVPWRDGQAHLAGECATGETGVIVFRGPHVGPGYTDPARNVGMFEADGWLVSGDLGHLDANGYLHVTGRAKDVIIRGSHNIDPQLVEDAFLAHPAVAICAVVGEPDAHSGEVPAAFVTLKPGVSIAGAGLLAEVMPTVYERPAVPKRVVVLEAMPTTAVGKIYKPALRLRAIELKLQE
ncbi:MAG: acyl-CoA synthase, partial [Comamonadaceae bacterium]